MNPSSQAAPELSIVVPALDEQDNVAPLIAQVEQAILSAGIAAELIVVDDGSTDQTLPRLMELRSTRPWLRVLHRDRPQGQSAAMYAGIQIARGQFVATLDADLQNDPADLPTLLGQIRRGEADMAQGLRARRHDSAIRLFSSWVGRTARGLILGDKIHDTGCTTRVLRASLARQILLQFRGMHRFMPAYARILGAKVIEVPVNHRPRAAGVAKYGMWNRAFVGLIDCFAVRWMSRRYRNPAAPEQTSK
jgi:glycosyltransferase involved in cell wall biosynthesis